MMTKSRLERSTGHRAHALQNVENCSRNARRRTLLTGHRFVRKSQRKRKEKQTPTQTEAREAQNAHQLMVPAVVAMVLLLRSRALYNAHTESTAMQHQCATF